MSSSITSLRAFAPEPVDRAECGHEDRLIQTFAFDLGERGSILGLDHEAELVLVIHEQAATVIAILKPVGKRRAMHIRFLQEPGWFRETIAISRNPGATLVDMVAEWQAAQ